MLRKHPLRSAYSMGLVYYGYQISWLRGIRSSELTDGSLAKIIGLLPFIIATTTFAVTLPLFVWLYGRLKIRSDQIRFLFVTPLLWILSESLISIVFSIVSSGVGARIGDYWHFGNVGLALAGTSLVYLSRWGGLYLLSYTAVLIMCTIVYCVKAKKPLPLLVVIAGVVALNVLAFQLYKTPRGKEISVVAVGSGILDEAGYVNNPLPNTAKNVPVDSADVIVLPEYSRYWEYDSDTHAAVLADALKDKSGLVIDSESKRLDGRQYNVVAFSNAKGEHYNEQFKWFVVPGGEFVPYIFRGPLRLMGQAKAVTTFENTKSVTPGMSPEEPFFWRGVWYGSLACSAANTPELYRGIVSRGAEVLVNTASLGTVGLGAKYHDNSFIESRLHAVANARPFIQSARGGYNFILDSNGSVLAKNTNQDNNFVAAKVKSNSQSTVYSIFGNWIVVLAGVTIILMLVIEQKNYKLPRLLYKRVRAVFNNRHKN